jgi:hypothetical protein
MFPGLWTPTGESLLSKPWGFDVLGLFCMLMTLFFQFQFHLSRYNRETRKISQMAGRLNLLEDGHAQKEKKVPFILVEHLEDMLSRIELLEKGVAQKEEKKAPLMLTADQEKKDAHTEDLEGILTRLALLEREFSQIVVAEERLSSEMAAHLHQKLATGLHWGKRLKELQNITRNADERAALYKVAKEAQYTGIGQ